MLAMTAAGPRSPAASLFYKLCRETPSRQGVFVPTCKVPGRGPYGPPFARVDVSTYNFHQHAPLPLVFIRRSVIAASGTNNNTERLLLQLFAEKDKLLESERKRLEEAREADRKLAEADLKLAEAERKGLQEVWESERKRLEEVRDADRKLAEAERKRLEEVWESERKRLEADRDAERKLAETERMSSKTQLQMANARALAAAGLLSMRGLMGTLGCTPFIRAGRTIS